MIFGAGIAVAIDIALPTFDWVMLGVISSCSGCFLFHTRPGNSASLIYGTCVSVVHNTHERSVIETLELLFPNNSSNILAGNWRVFGGCDSIT